MRTTRAHPRVDQPARPALALGLVLLVGVVANLALNLFLPDALYVPAALGLALLLVVVAVRVGGCSAAELGLDRRDLPGGLRWGAAAMALVALVLVVAAALPATRDLFADRRVDETSVAALLYATLVRIPFGTVALEETLFRGVLLGLAMKLGSTRRAVVASCLLFGIWHTLPARGLTAANPTAVTVSAGLGGEVLAVALAVGAAALAGLPFCWLRLRSRSLLAPVMAHIATNSFGYAVAWVTLRALGG